MATGREQALHALREHLGRTRVGASLGLPRIRSLEDLRATVPLMDRKTHVAEVEHKLGFGVVDPNDPLALELSGAAREREAVVAVWRRALGDSPSRVALVRAIDREETVDTILVADLKALGGNLQRIDHADDPTATLAALEELDPQVLVVPSKLTCAWLERAHRVPLERRLPSLRLVLAEHDLRRRLRSQIKVMSAGWAHPTGRLGLPSPRAIRSSMTLAVGTQIIELLPHADPQTDGRRGFSDETVWPEQATVGTRYEVVVTSPLGCVRLRTDEHVRVVGFDAPSEAAPFPRPRIVRLPPTQPDLKLEGCTLAGPSLTAAVRHAFLPEDPALVAAEISVDPDSFPPGAAQSTGSMRLPAAFADTELGWMARVGSVGRRGSRGRSVLVRVEVQGHVQRALPGRLSGRIDADLRRRAPAYDYLRERGELHAPRVMNLPAGTYRAEEERRVVRLLGPVYSPELRVVA